MDSKLQGLEMGSGAYGVTCVLVLIWQCEFQINHDYEESLVFKQKLGVIYSRSCYQYRSPSGVGKYV
jgi:hypothetical protein